MKTIANTTNKEIIPKSLESLESLVYENKMMAEALETLGYTQENISVIKSGEFIPRVISDENLEAKALSMFWGDGSMDALQSFNNDNGKNDEFGPCEAFEDWPLENIKREVEYVYGEFKKLATPTLVRSEKSEAEDNKYRNTLTCNSCASGEDTQFIKELKYLKSIHGTFDEENQEEYLDKYLTEEEEEEEVYECEKCGRDFLEEDIETFSPCVCKVCAQDEE